MIVSGCVVELIYRIHADLRVGKILTRFSPAYMRLIQQLSNCLMYTNINISFRLYHLIS